ncbi:hypothetical protein ZIOFF_018200 [Zingiber officinale]|uniref:Uncharacterized protein n=1 Tax=Zingiber officinale TaxID=94328 RepID=A0A8J5H7W8_ZINOF|nr:hypothetical protein ZIOFF_018200 [Zingiber officinale]
MEKPHVDFGLKLLGGDVMSIPGLYKFVQVNVEFMFLSGDTSVQLEFSPLLLVGGRDIVLVDVLSRRIPLISDRPTIIFGADVTHSHPGEDSSPSIVVVNASKAYFCPEGKSRTAWFTIELQVTCEMGS